MFDPTSRYYSLGTVTYEMPNGREVSYKRRRFPPQGDSLPILTEVTVIGGDRLDVITARTIGNPEQFWRICDAENAMNPDVLTREPGRTLRVPFPRVNE